MSAAATMKVVCLCWLGAAVLTLVAAFPAAAQTVELVEELNQGGRGTGPTSVVSFEGELYFAAEAGSAGRELMRHDGSNVSLAADIHPSGSSSPTELTVHDGVLYFTADDGLHGRRLWAFDGAGARLVDSTGYVATAQELISFEDSLCFRGVRFGDVGIELFRFDGETISFLDIFPGTGSSYPQHFAEYAGTLCFSAGGAPGQGSELWRYDGVAVTKAGQEIRAGSGSAPAWLTTHDGQLYFAANDGVHGNELWRFDGTSSSLAADLNPGGEYDSSNPSWLASFGGSLYCCANGGGGDGNELWRFDGTSFEMVAEINPNPPGPGGDDFLADSNPFEFTVHDGKLFFFADDGLHGRELWAWDGACCYLVADIRNSDSQGSNPSGLAVVDGQLLFGADSGEGFGLELYRVLPQAGPRIPNGGFETGGLLPWVLTGAGAVVTETAFDPAIAPADGRFMGYITTLNNEGAEDFGYFDDSPDIDGDGERESEYSAMSISFTAPVAGTVSVDLNFLTDELLRENTPDTGGADLFGLSSGEIRTGPYLLLSVVAPSDGSYGGTASRLTPDAFTVEWIEESNFGVFPTIPDASRFQGQTGFRRCEFPVAAGVHSWTFFVADSHTDGVSSAMLIDNLQFLATPAPVAAMASFGTITLAPALELDGAGSNVDSIAFWEAPDPADTLMFVTAKGNDLVEVWQFPFVGNELPSIPFAANVNGVAVDQETDLLYVSDRIVTVISLPGLSGLGDFGEGIIGVGENNLDILKHTGGQTVIYVSDDHNVHRFDAASRDHLGSFQPAVSSIETVLADDFHQMILVPEEQGPEGNPGVFAHHPDGSPFERNGTNRFGNGGEFDSDEEGIILYTFPTSGVGDFGTGLVVVSDQKSTQTDFEFYDRRTWEHLGTLRLTGVSNTDGIASTQKPLPGYPLGLFAAINNDTTTALIGWDAIFGALFTPYDLWAADHGLVAGVNSGFDDDPDMDGCPNGREFATDGDPLGSSGRNKEHAAVGDFGGADHLSYTFPARTGAVFSGDNALTSTIDGVVYTVAGAHLLTDFTEGIIEVVPALDSGLPALDPGWSYRSFRLSRAISESPAGFIRMAVAKSAGP